MSEFSFTVFLSAFQLLPTAPFHILALGGSATEAGLFLGFLTYASAISAPITGAHRRSLRQAPRADRRSLAITVFSLLYAVAPSYQIMLGAGRWSTACSGRDCCRARAAYVIDIVPKSRRAEGLGYSGFASILAVAMAPWIGLWVFDHGGWRLLCLEAAVLNMIMAFIAWRLPPDTRARRGHAALDAAVRTWSSGACWSGAVTLFLYSFSYGGITSFVAVYAEQLGVTPRALYFTVFCLTISARGRSSAAMPIASATRGSSCRAW